MGKAVVDNISLATVLDGTANAALLDLFRKMQEASEMWRVNHLVRSITSLVLATSFLVGTTTTTTTTTFGTGTFGAVINGFVGSFLLASVWITMAAPGFVSTRFINAVLCKLMNLDLESEEKTTALIQRISSTRNSIGITFAGVPMSVAKATTLTSAMGYLIYYTFTQEATRTGGCGI
jgi:hypothetical protein